MSNRPMITNGAIFPTSSARGRIGVTSTCSRVPISRSRASPIADVNVVTMTRSIAAMPGTMYGAVLSRGLNAMRGTSRSCAGGRAPIAATRSRASRSPRSPK